MPWIDRIGWAVVAASVAAFALVFFWMLWPVVDALYRHGLMLRNLGLGG